MLRRTTTAVFLAVWLAGCGTMPDSASAPSLAPTPLASCDKPDTSRLCQTSLCAINVSGPANKPVVDPYTLVVPPNTPVTIVWHLAESGAVFRNNDGPRFERFDPHSENEFERIGPSDSAGNAVNPPSAFYAVKYKNTQSQKRHKHSVKFKGQNGHDAECDPTINNTTN